VISVVLVGARGRMGRAIERAAQGADDLVIAGRVDEALVERIGEVGAEGPAPGYGAGSGTGGLDGVVRPGDVVVEFSSPEGLRRAAAVCRERRVPLVSGTTGLGPGDEAELGALAELVPVLRAANFSLGLLALRRALGAALSGLPERWDIEIVERHHRGKVDSPSGTALGLARDAARARGWDDDALRHGRSGRVGPRPSREIGVHAVRGGTWVGDHAVLLAGEGESLELRHLVEDRAAFAFGALAAARFVAHARPGRYGLEDLLGA